MGCDRGPAVAVAGEHGAGAGVGPRFRRTAELMDQSAVRGVVAGGGGSESLRTRETRRIERDAILDDVSLKLGVVAVAIVFNHLTVGRISGSGLDTPLP